MITIHKFWLDVARSVNIEMPVGAKALAVQEQHGRTWLWAMVDTDQPLGIRRFKIRGTGNDCFGVDPEHYLATVQSGPFVWHVFDLGYGDAL